MADGPQAGLALVDGIDGLEEYHLFHSARADLLRRLGRTDEASVAYERALELAPSDVERDVPARPARCAGLTGRR